LLNGVFTIVCGLIITYYAVKKLITSSIFHYAWAAGFLIYGFEIVIRALGAPLLIAQLLYFAASILFVVGIWQLCKTKLVIVTFSMGIAFLFLSAGLFLWGIVSEGILQFISVTILFLFVAIAILQHRLLFGRSTDKLAIGWVLLYLTNLILSNLGWMQDAFAVTAKVIILIGILEYDFVIIADKAQARRYPAPEAGYGDEGGLKLLMSTENLNSALKEANWVKEKTSENVREGVETIIFAFQDVFPHKELRAIKWINPEKVSVYLFSSSAQKVKAEFIVLPMGLAQIGSTLFQATSQCQKTDKGCTVVFLHLSLLIQLFGAEAVYSMIVNKMGYLRENGINLYAVFYPTMHSDPSVVSLFNKLADESIKL